MRDAALDARERRAGAGVDTAAERDVLADVFPVEMELVRVSNRRGSRFAAPGLTITVVPAGHRGVAQRR